LAAKYTISDLLTVTVSGLFNLKNPANAFDISKGLLAFPFGFETTLNVWETNYLQDWMIDSL